MPNEIDIQEKKQAAFMALQSGSFLTASRKLTELSQAVPQDVSVWMGLSLASMQIADAEAALKAVDRALELQPRNFSVLLMKADILQEAGNPSAGATFYQAALQMAPPENQQTEKMKTEVARARRMVDQAAQKYETALRTSLAEEGFLTDRGRNRYDETIDILFAKRQIYVQQPHDFYFPRLPQIQFYDRSDFDWTPGLEAKTDAITAEVAQILRDDVAAFKPYLHARGGPRLEDIGLMDNVDWSAFYLIEMGQVVEENAARCPATMAALKSVPLCEVSDKMPSVLFSLLRPKTRIEPHNGLFNTRLICHLPLIVPDGCHLRVGNETRQWVKGETLIFDDSIEHEAANGGDELRVVLLFDIWRPELSDRDKDFIRAVFRTIDESSGEASDG